MNPSWIIALGLAALLVVAGWQVRGTRAERDAAQVRAQQLQAAVEQQKQAAATIKRQQEVADAETIRLEERKAEFAQQRDGLLDDLERSLRDAATRARAASVPTVSAAARAVPNAAAGARLQPAPARVAAPDRDAGAFDRFNAAVSELARHADAASAAADTAAAERNALTRIWQQYRDDDQARRQTSTTLGGAP